MPAERAGILSRLIGRGWIYGETDEAQAIGARNIRVALSAVVLLGASTAVFAQGTAQVLREQDGCYLDERVLANK